MRSTKTFVVTLFVLVASASCGSDSKMTATDDAATGASDGLPGSAQTPPTGATAVEAWLAQKQYLTWHCEAAPHPQRSPSPHGRNRICSNDLLSSHTTGEYPAGAAAVKELFGSSGDAAGGYAVYLHTKGGTEGGDWYWYEKLPGTRSPVADGSGDSGPAKSICVSCHAAAGSDSAHSGHDFVYTQVK